MRASLTPENSLRLHASLMPEDSLRLQDSLRLRAPLARDDSPHPPVPLETARSSRSRTPLALANPPPPCTPCATVDSPRLAVLPASDLSPRLHALLTLELACTERANRAIAYRGVRPVFCTVSRLGDGLLWYAMMAIAIALDGDHGLQAVAHMLLVAGLGLALYLILKVHTARPRPYEVHSTICCGADPLDAFSFPSGHTLHAVAFAILFAWYYPATAAFVLAFAALVAVSRLVLGLHYPSDVLAGAVIGGGLAVGSLVLMR